MENATRQAHGQHRRGDAAGGNGDPLAGGSGLVRAALQHHDIGQGG
ncbi:hypothetical protein [Synechococcus sp. MW101C3]|nr:hypothetical protein [Synechococcus sp. MW101C3]